MDEFFVSVIIPTLNRDDLLCGTIEALLAQEYRFFEVIIVDQSDRPGVRLAALLEKAGMRVRYYRLEVKGLPSARNFGAQHARGDIILFLDDDGVPAREFIAHHAAHYHDPRTGCVTGRVESPHRRERAEASSYPGLIGARIGCSGRVYSNFIAERRGYTFSARGCNMSVRKDLYESVGGFDTAFIGTFQYEEADLSYRLRRHGTRIVYEPEAVVMHYEWPEGGCVIADETKTEYFRFHNAMVFYLKNMRRPLLPYMVATFFLIAIKKMLIQQKSPRDFFYVIHGLIDGVRTYMHRNGTHHRTVPIGKREASSRPSAILVELTNRCNYACPICPLAASGYPKTDMDLSLFRKIIDQTREWCPGIRSVTLHAFGEPFLHPQVFECLDYLRIRLPRCVVKMSTNFSTVDDETIRRLFSPLSGELELGVWVDAISSSTYRAQRGAGASYEKVMHNLEYLIELKRRSRARNPRFHIGMVITRTNQDELRRFRLFWKRKIAGIEGAEIRTALSHDWGGQISNEDVLLRDNRRLAWRKRCKMPFTTLVVFSNGDAGLCCYDVRHRIVVGSVRGESLPSLWGGRRARLFRRSMRSLELDAFEPCRNCFSYNVSLPTLALRMPPFIVRTLSAGFTGR